MNETVGFKVGVRHKILSAVTFSLGRQLLEMDLKNLKSSLLLDCMRCRLRMCGSSLVGQTVSLDCGGAGGCVRVGVLGVARFP